MISIFATFKGMDTEQKTIIQHNAIQSWLKLNPKPQVIVLGDELGVRELCQKYAVEQVPELKVASSGAPYLDDMIRKAEAVATNDIMLLVSGDIMILQDTIEIAKSLKDNPRFCVCARKRNVGVKAIDFSNENWMNELEYQDWNLWAAGDYFLYRKGFFAKMPPFIAGRSSVDNWMFKLACHHECLINATEVASVLHPNHGERVWDMMGIGHEEHPEVQHNRRLYQENDIKDLPWGYIHYIGINHANWIMNKDYTLMMG